MKFAKLLQVLCAIFATFLPSTAQAITFHVSSPMKTSAGALIKNLVMTNGSAVTTERIDASDNIGFTGLLVQVDASGDLDIYAEYSLDGTNFYRVYYTPNPMDGTSTQEGLIVQALSSTTRLIRYIPQPFKYYRFVLDPDADSTVTASFAYSKDR